MSESVKVSKEAWKFLHSYGFTFVDGEAEVKVATMASILSQALVNERKRIVNDLRADAFYGDDSDLGAGVRRSVMLIEGIK